MLIKIKLKNSESEVLLDSNVYEALTQDAYLAQIDILNNLRLHSSGCAVFQKTWKKPDGSYKTETIYLHKLVAERFLAEKRNDIDNLVGSVSGNKLDCRLENLMWRSRAVASRQRKSSNSTGYTGVYKENSRYRAMISYERRTIHLGMYDSADEAAEAYNRKSLELYGNRGKINQINKPE